MRIILVTLGTLIIVFLGFSITKMWGRGQHYVEYRHPFLSVSEAQQPVIFVKPTYDKMRTALDGNDNLFLDVAMTSDQILVLPLEKLERGVRYYSVADLKDKALDISQLAPVLKSDRKFIFNLLENTRAVHEVFVENLKKIGIEGAKNFLVTSDYEAPLRALKELNPEYLFGTSKPEILKIVAMESMNLIEAVTLRADVLIHPLKIKNQDFYSKELTAEMLKRFKKIIVGPVIQSDLEKARQLKPYGIIVE